MSLLSRVTKGKQQGGAILGFYGPPGVGKTTAVAGIPGCVLIDAERSSAHYEVEARFTPSNWSEVYEITREIMLSAEIGGVVYDSLDAIQTLSFEEVCSRESVKNIADIPYGRGYEYALVIWRDLVQMWKNLATSGRLVGWTCHEQVTKVEDPVHGMFERVGLKLHAKIAALIVESSDVVAHVGIRQMVSTNKAGKGKATVLVDGDGIPERFFRCHPTGGVLAKTRFSHPAGELTPLEWSKVREFCS